MRTGDGVNGNSIGVPERRLSDAPVSALDAANPLGMNCSAAETPRVSNADIVRSVKAGPRVGIVLIAATIAIALSIFWIYPTWVRPALYPFRPSCGTVGSLPERLAGPDHTVTASEFASAHDCFLTAVRLHRSASLRVYLYGVDTVEINTYRTRMRRIELTQTRQGGGPDT